MGVIIVANFNTFIIHLKFQFLARYKYLAINTKLISCFSMQVCVVFK